MGKVALVTGSSSGIGLETVLALARDGYETLASMRDIKKYGLKPRLLAVFDSKGSAVDQSGLKLDNLIQVQGIFLLRNILKMEY